MGPCKSYYVAQECGLHAATWEGRPKTSSATARSTRRIGWCWATTLGIGSNDLLGGSMKIIVVTDYDQAWPVAFDRLRAHYLPSVHDLAVAIEHVGSTSVPGLAAKPIIDMNIVVPSDVEVSIVIERLAVQGLVHVGNLGVEGREAFNYQGPPTRGLPPHHLYLSPQGSLGLANQLAVRDYLRMHPETAEAYGDLKRKLANQFPHDIESYVAGKTELILWILQQQGFSAEHLATIERANRRE